VFSFPPRFLDLHRGRAGLVPSDAAASLARRKPRRATQNDASDAWTRRDSRTRRVRSDIRAVGSGRSGGFVWLSPLLGFVRGEFGVGWVRSAHWVRPDARTAGFVRMFAPSGPVAPLGSFGSRHSRVRPLRGSVGRAGFVRSAGLVWILELPGSFETGARHRTCQGTGVAPHRESGTGAPPTDALQGTSAHHLCTSAVGLPTGRPNGAWPL
jgi:hypothetical protein